MYINSVISILHGEQSIKRYIYLLTLSLSSPPLRSHKFLLMSEKYELLPSSWLFSVLSISPAAVTGLFHQARWDMVEREFGASLRWRRLLGDERPDGKGRTRRFWELVPIFVCKTKDKLPLLEWQDHKPKILLVKIKIKKSWSTPRAVTHFARAPAEPFPSLGPRKSFHFFM